MNIAIRIVLTLICGVATLFFVLWFVLGFVLWLKGPLFLLPPFSFWFGFAIALLAAAGVAWYVWTHMVPLPSSFAHSFLLWGLVVGGLGFSAGFFGPLLVLPHTGGNLAPLLGFVTGPLGFILGAACGGIHWYARAERAVS